AGVRSARRGARRVPPHLQDALNKNPRLVLWPVLPLRGATLPASARAEAAPADLGRRPQQGGPAPGGPVRQRLAPSRRQRRGPAPARGAARAPRGALPLGGGRAA